MSLPSSGIVYVDSSPFIYTVELHPVYAPLLRPFWQGLAEGRLRVVTSELALLEVLVGAFRANDSLLQADYVETLTDPLIRLLPVDRDVLAHAAKLRATRLGLRTPDAIHVATADLAGCGAFVTNDKGLRAALPNVVVLDDLRA